MTLWQLARHFAEQAPPDCRVPFLCDAEDEARRERCGCAAHWVVFFSPTAKIPDRAFCETHAREQMGVL